MTEIWDKTPKKNKDTGMWEIRVFTPEGVFLELKEYKTQSDAFSALKKFNDTNPNSPKNSAKKKEEKKGTFLENQIGEYDDELNIGSFLDPEKERLFEEQYADKVTAAETEAKGLLEQVAKLYLTASIIDSNEYLKFKMEVEAKGLSSLIFQVHVAQKAIYRLQREMELGNVTNLARMNEVLVQLIRASLDIAKFQHEYIDKLQESMKRFRLDVNLNDDDLPALPDGDGVATIGSSVVTNDRKQLLSSLNDIMEEAKNLKIPQSRNENLHDDDPRVVQVEYKEVSEWETDASDDDSGNLGLSTFDDDSDGGDTYDDFEDDEDK